MISLINNNRTVALLFGLVVILASISTLTVKKPAANELVTLHPQYPAEFSDDRVLVGASHNIFVGKVLRQVGTVERGIGPETQFEVEVLDNIKGEFVGTTIVNQQGGYSEGKLYVIEGDLFTKDSTEESLLQIGSTYLFMTRYSPKYDWNTLVSVPGANKLLNDSEFLSKNVEKIEEYDPRVAHIKYLYQDEILLDADVLSGNALNSFVTTQKKSDQ